MERLEIHLESQRIAPPRLRPRNQRERTNSVPVFPARPKGYLKNTGYLKDTSRLQTNTASSTHRKPATRFLAYRGFDSDSIRHALDKAWQDEEEWDE